MNRTVTVASLLAIALASPLAATAQPSSSPGDHIFASFDTDKDDRISVREHVDGARRMFQSMDGNRDERVTAAEMTAAQQRVTGRTTRPGEASSADKIRFIDTNGDGVLTAEEHAAGSRSVFEKMDKDRDGHLSRDELAAGHEEMLKRPHR